MTRVTNAIYTKKRRKRILKLASGYFGNKSRLYRYAKDAVMRAGQFAYRDRRKKKTIFRQLWITRINAATREYGTNYNKLINGLKFHSILLNRKMISEMAIHDQPSFKKLIEKSKEIHL